MAEIKTQDLPALPDLMSAFEREMIAMGFDSPKRNAKEDGYFWQQDCAMFTLFKHLRTTSQPVGVPEAEEAARRGFWDGFECARLSPKDWDIRKAWNNRRDNVMRLVMLTASPTPPVVQPASPRTMDVLRKVHQHPDEPAFWIGDVSTIVCAQVATPTAAGDEAAQDLIAKRAARWDWVAQFLSVDDVGDEKSMYSLVLNADGLEDAAWRARMLDVLEFTSDGTDTSIESFVDAAIAAQSAEAGKVGG